MYGRWLYVRPLAPCTAVGSVYDLWLRVQPLAPCTAVGSVYGCWLHVWPSAPCAVIGSMCGHRFHVSFAEHAVNVWASKVPTEVEILSNGCGAGLRGWPRNSCSSNRVVRSLALPTLRGKANVAPFENAVKALPFRTPGVQRWQSLTPQ